MEQMTSLIGKVSSILNFSTWGVLFKKYIILLYANYKLNLKHSKKYFQLCILKPYLL